MSNSVATTQVPASQTSQAAAGGAGSSLGMFVPFIVIFVLLYLLLIRPQQKREAQKRDRLSKLKKGDKVLTNGGAIAVVSKILDENEVMLEVAPNVEVKFYKGFIADFLDKKPAENGKGKSEKKPFNSRTKFEKNDAKKQERSTSEEGKEEKKDNNITE